MKAKDAELAKMEVERKRLEIQKWLDEIRQKISKVPPSVLNGSHAKAVAFKETALRGFSLLKSQRPTLEKVRSCARELDGFWN